MRDDLFFSEIPTTPTTTPDTELLIKKSCQHNANFPVKLFITSLFTMCTVSANKTATEHDSIKQNSNTFNRNNWFKTKGNYSRTQTTE